MKKQLNRLLNVAITAMAVLIVVALVQP